LFFFLKQQEYNKLHQEESEIAIVAQHRHITAVKLQYNGRLHDLYARVKNGGIFKNPQAETKHY
jgi:hypothetical protein